MAHEGHADSAGKLVFHVARGGIGGKFLSAGFRRYDENSTQAAQTMVVAIETVVQRLRQPVAQFGESLFGEGLVLLLVSQGDDDGECQADQQEYAGQQGRQSGTNLALDGYDHFN